MHNTDITKFSNSTIQDASVSFRVGVESPKLCVLFTQLRPRRTQPRTEYILFGFDKGPDRRRFHARTDLR